MSPRLRNHGSIMDYNNEGASDCGGDINVH